MTAQMEERKTMQEKMKPSLLRLMWWSIRLTWSRNKVTRRRCRQQIWSGLSQHWRVFVPDAAPGTEAAIVRAVWLGASLASRSLLRYPLLPRRLKTRLTWIVRLLGRSNGKAVVTAYLAWTWLSEVALSSTQAQGTWTGAGGN